MEFYFIMIRKFVPVKENVTDFCCVLKFLGMNVLNSIFEILSGESYSLLQTQNAANFMMKEWKKMIKLREKGWLNFLRLFTQMFGTIA